jgi:hypothetical protein
MPLNKGENNIGYNIEKLKNEAYKVKQAQAIALSEAYDDNKESESRPSSPVKTQDDFGFLEIKGNPISKSGIFEYLGSEVGKSPPDKIFKVLRPAEELSDPECIESFKLLPWTDDHYAIVGMEEKGRPDVADVGVDGVLGEDIYFDEHDGFLKGNIKVFTQKMHDLIKNGKKELSIGFISRYDDTKGVYEGKHFDLIQRNIRGNHIALVDQGRCGSEVAVMDSKFFKVDLRGINMSEEKMGYDQEIEGEVTLKDVVELLKSELAKITELVSSSATQKETSVLDEEIEADVSSDADVVVVVKDDDVDVSVVTEDTSDVEVLDNDKSETMDAKMNSYQKELINLKAQVVALKNSHSSKAIFSEVSRRDALANKLFPIIGTFDHSSKTQKELATYAVKKLGLSCKSGHEEEVLSGYMQARESVHTPSQKVGSFDSMMNQSKGSSEVDNFLKEIN